MDFPLRQDFVVLSCALPLSFGLDLLRLSGARFLVLFRQKDRQEYYYLFYREEVEYYAERFPPDAPLERVLDLHEWRADAAAELTDFPQELPERLIVLDHGTVVSIFAPPLTRASRGDLETSTEPPGEVGGEMETLPVLIPLQANASLPASAQVGESLALKVNITSLAQEVSAGALTFSAPQGATLQVTVQVRRGLELTGEASQSFTLPAPPVRWEHTFSLRARQEGTGEARVLIFGAGVLMGYLTLRTEIHPVAVTAEAAISASARTTLPAISVAAPDLQVVILEENENGRRGFTLMVNAADASLGINFAQFGPLFFQNDPGKYFETFYREMDALYRLPDRQAAQTLLKASGITLFTSLFPPDLQQLLWSIRGRIQSVLIQSTEPWIPWELCALRGVENGQVVEGDFLAEAYAVTRWMPGIPLKQAFSLKRIGVVIPQNSGLAFAQQEWQFLQSLAGNDRRVERVPARFVNLVQAFTAGEYTAWHFSGHGVMRTDDPLRAEMILEEPPAFTPMLLSGALANVGNTSPLVFLNACQMGQSGMALTDAGGWAQQFIRAGASAFIGAYWSVQDASARDFAESLYNHLVSGKTLGQAALLARQAVLARNPLTALAYTIFGHPNAICAG